MSSAGNRCPGGIPAAAVQAPVHDLQDVLPLACLNLFACWSWTLLPRAVLGTWGVKMGPEVWSLVTLFGSSPALLWYKHQSLGLVLASCW